MSAKGRNLFGDRESLDRNSSVINIVKYIFAIFQSFKKSPDYRAINSI